MDTILYPLSKIQSNPRQPRAEFDAGEMASLVASVKEYGILQPLLVTLLSDGMATLIAGERRLRAAREAELLEVPVLVVPEASDQTMLELALIENVQRADLNPIEKAHAYQQLSEDFGLTHEDIAGKVGVNRTTITNTLRLLKLPAEITQALLDGSLKERAALALLGLYELPESLRKEAENGYYGNIKPSFIISQTINGGMSSEGIRKSIDELVERLAKKLNNASWDLDYIFVTGEAIYWPECRTCEMRHKALNVCTKPDCFAAKERAFKVDYLQQASQASGIILLESDIAIYDVTKLAYRASAEAILNNGCQNLRLMYEPYNPGGPFSLEKKGFPKAQIVCMKRNGHCQCLKGLEILEAQKRREAVQAIQDTPRAEDEAEEVYIDVPEPEEAEESQEIPTQESEEEPHTLTAEELREITRQEKKKQKEYEQLAKDARAQAVAVVEKGLESNETGAWSLIYNRLALGSSWDNRPDDLIAVRRGIAEKLVQHQVEYVQPRDVPDRLKEMLIRAGLQTPKF